MRFSKKSKCLIDISDMFSAVNPPAQKLSISDL